MGAIRKCHFISKRKVSRIILSIIICTHNRADLARDAILSVLNQEIYTEEEILVIDNASTDHTAKIVQELEPRYPSIRYIFEPKVGLSNARNRGWQEARGKYVAYIDDDTRLPPHWLQRALKIISTEAPIAFGGPFYAQYNTPKPEWYKDEYGSYLFADKVGYMEKEGCITGGNMFIKQEILAQLNGFPVDMGMNGKKAGYAEETQLLRRMVDMYGKCLYFDPELFIYHIVSPKKMRLISHLRIQYASGRDYQFAIYKGQRLRLRSILHEIFNLLLAIVYEIIRALARDKKKYPYFQQYIVDKTSRKVLELGIQYARLKTYFNHKPDSD
jgi:glucosyl-dolichyl phosphate glucuronosyltransferase